MGEFASQLAETGYAFVHASAIRQALEAHGSLADWPAFVASWNDLELDEYLAERERYRRRRFAVYAVDSAGAIVRQPHQPHFQHQDYNRLFGGVERWFAPILPDIGESQTMLTVVRFCDRLFRGLAGPDTTGRGPQRRPHARQPRVGPERRPHARQPRVGPERGSRVGVAWHVEVHQFRIEAKADAPGQPTPEGVHRDGVDYVLVLLVSRENIVSGTTTVYDLSGSALGSFTLTDPFDAALVDDNRVAHGVTPVAPLDPARPGHRDVLVVTFKKR